MMNESHGAEGSPADFLWRTLRTPSADRPAWADVLRRTVRALSARPGYDWTGIYLVEGAVLRLGPFAGDPTEHVRIPVGEGICGAAAAEAATIVVDDVGADPRYLACFISTRSEIVVPIFAGGAPDRGVIGEIDVDSNQPAQFTDEDRILLEEVAGLLGQLAPRDATAAVTEAERLLP